MENKIYSINVEGLPFKPLDKGGFSESNQESLNIYKNVSGTFTFYNVESDGVLVGDTKNRETIDNNCVFVYPMGVRRFTKICGIMIRGWEHRTIAPGKCIYIIKVGTVDISGEMHQLAEYSFIDKEDKLHNNVCLLNDPYEIKTNMTLYVKVEKIYPSDGKKELISGDIIIYYQ